MQYVAIVGTLGSGYEFYGPYDTAVQAAQVSEFFPAGVAVAPLDNTEQCGSIATAEVTLNVAAGKSNVILLTGEQGSKATIHGPFASMDQLRHHATWLCCPWTPAVLEVPPKRTTQG